MTTPTLSGLVAIGMMLLFLMTGMPVGIALGVASIVGFGVFFHGDLARTFSPLATSPYFTTSDYNLVIIPLFVLMGLFAVEAGLAEALYDMFWKWFGRFRGGLSYATVAANALFGAVCGSSVVSTAVFTKLSLRHMLAHRYNKVLACGTLSCAGILAVLIPPSSPIVIYGILTEESIGALLLGGAGPGILLAILLAVTVYVVCRLRPELAPASPEPVPFREKLASLKPIWYLPVLAVIITGGIYQGVFTPTESAAIGCIGTFIPFLLRKGLDWKGLKNSLIDTGRISCMVFLVIIGARMFSQIITVSGLARSFLAAVVDAGLPVSLIIVALLILYLVLGCFLDLIAMLLLTLPFIYPVLKGMGIDIIWLGVLIVVTCEVGLVTPPMGLNVFALKSAADFEKDLDVSLGVAFKGAFLFLPALLLCVVIIFLVPPIVTWLPSHMSR